MTKSGESYEYPKRTHITYELENGDCIEIKELPFVVGVLANLCGHPSEPLARLRERRFITIDTENLDCVLEGMMVHLAFSTDNKIGDEPFSPPLKIDLVFKSMADFEPENVARQVKPLRDLLDERRQLISLLGYSSSSLNEALLAVVTDGDAIKAIAGEIQGTEIQPGGGLEMLLKSFPKPPLGPFCEEMASDLLRTFIKGVIAGDISITRHLDSMIEMRIACIDYLLSIQTAEILHHPSFQDLEASWRGLLLLAQRNTCPERMKVKVLNVSKRELLKDLQRAPEFDQSALFHKLYDDELTIRGGEPYSLIVGDYYFSHLPEDVELLERISQVASAVQAPFIAGTSPSMLLLETFNDLDKPRSIARICRTNEHQKWNSFREAYDSRFVGLALPRVLFRHPYTCKGPSRDMFRMEENPTSHADYLWGNAAFAIAERYISACNRLSWPAGISSAENGAIPDLPVHSFFSDEGYSQRIGPTEVAFGASRENELTTAGFIPLCQCSGTNIAVVSAMPSCRAQPDELLNAGRVEDSPIGLEYAFALSRFSHYLLAISRDRLGVGFLDVADCQRWLNRWLQDWVAPGENCDEKGSANRPLREGCVEVTGGRLPKQLRFRVKIRPHFLLRCPVSFIEGSIELSRFSGTPW